MSLIEIFRFAFRGLSSNKLRTALTTLGIAIGVSSVIILLAVGNGSSKAVQSGIERSRIGAVYLGNFISGPLNGKEVLAGLVAEQLGLSGIPCTKVEGACASGGVLED